MAPQTLIATDAANGVDLPACELTSAEGGYLRKRTLAGGPSQGVQVIEMNNGPLTLSLVPTRGMGVWKGTFNNLPLEWKSPVEHLMHPALVDQRDRDGLGWLNGFNELMCRCGLVFNGPPGADGKETLTLHGRIANIPAHRVELRVDAMKNGVVEVMGEVDETSLFGPRLRLRSTVRMEPNTGVVEFVDEVVNLGAKPAHLSLLYHVNLGRPFLEEGSQVVTAFREMAPRDARAAENALDYATFKGPTANYAEQVYYFKPARNSGGWGTALLHNAQGTAGFAVSFQTAELPCFTLWKNTAPEADGYVTGLEPGVNFPNFRSFERDQGRLPAIEPGGSYRTQMKWEIYDTEASVRQAVRQIQLTQGGQPPVIHPQPQPGWSAAGG